MEACRRPDLLERSFESLKNIYICSLHFENGMYGKKSLKKTAIPTLLLPTKDSIHTQTDHKVTILSDVKLDLHNKPRKKRKIAQRDHELAGPSSQISQQTSTKKYIVMDCSSQIPARLTDHTPRKKRLRKQLFKTSNRLKTNTEKQKDITEKQFLRACDQFLSPKLSAIVKAQLYLKPHCKNNRYSRELKLFCLNMYYTSPLAYRFLSKTICLPSKSTLAMMYLPMTIKLNHQIRDI